MATVVPQILTLVGVLLGAVASFAATTLTERARWKRAYDTRWDDKRLTAYTDYANSIKTVVHVCYRLAGARGFAAGGIPIDRSTGLAALSEAERDRSIKWEPVLLLGSPDVVDAARAWHERLWKLEWLARGQEASEQEFAEMNQAFVRAREDFYAAARADLGVNSGVLPTPGARDHMQFKPLPDEELTE